MSRGLDEASRAEILRRLKETGLIPDTAEVPVARVKSIYKAVEKHCEWRTFDLPLGGMDNMSSYMLVFRGLVKMACLPFTVERVLAEPDPEEPERVNFSFVADGQAVNWRFHHDSSWMSEEFFSLAMNYLKTHSDEVFVNATPSEEWWSLISLPKPVVDAMEEGGIRVGRV